MIRVFIFWADHTPIVTFLSKDFFDVARELDTSQIDGFEANECNLGKSAKDDLLYLKFMSSLGCILIVILYLKYRSLQKLKSF